MQKTFDGGEAVGGERNLTRFIFVIYFSPHHIHARRVGAKRVSSHIVLSEYWRALTHSIWKIYQQIDSKSHKSRAEIGWYDSKLALKVWIGQRTMSAWAARHYVVIRLTRGPHLPSTYGRTDESSHLRHDEEDVWDDVSTHTMSVNVKPISTKRARGTVGQGYAVGSIFRKPQFFPLFLNRK